MTIRFKCQCGMTWGIPDEHAGEEGRCPICKRTFRVPGKRKPITREGTTHASGEIVCAECGRRLPAREVIKVRDHVVCRACLEGGSTGDESVTDSQRLRQVLLEEAGSTARFEPPRRRKGRKRGPLIAIVATCGVLCVGALILLLIVLSGGEGAPPEGVISRPGPLDAAGSPGRGTAQPETSSGTAPEFPANVPPLPDALEELRSRFTGEVVVILKETEVRVPSPHGGKDRDTRPCPMIARVRCPDGAVWRFGITGLHVRDSGGDDWTYEEMKQAFGKNLKERMIKRLRDLGMDVRVSARGRAAASGLTLNVHVKYACAVAGFQVDLPLQTDLPRGTFGSTSGDYRELTLAPQGEDSLGTPVDAPEPEETFPYGLEVTLVSAEWRDGTRRLPSLKSVQWTPPRPRRMTALHTEIRLERMEGFRNPLTGETIGSGWTPDTRHAYVRYGDIDISDQIEDGCAFLAKGLVPPWDAWRRVWDLSATDEDVLVCHWEALMNLGVADDVAEVVASGTYGLPPISARALKRLMEQTDRAGWMREFLQSEAEPYREWAMINCVRLCDVRAAWILADILASRPEAISERARDAIRAAMESTDKAAWVRPFADVPSGSWRDRAVRNLARLNDRRSAKIFADWLAQPQRPTGEDLELVVCAVINTPATVALPHANSLIKAGRVARFAHLSEVSNCLLLDRGNAVRVLGWLLREGTEEQRIGALEQAAQAGFTECAPTVAALATSSAETDADMIANAVLALRKLAPERAADVLLALTRRLAQSAIGGDRVSPSYGLRRNRSFDTLADVVTGELARSGDPRAGPGLVKVLRSPDGTTRMAVIAALKVLDDPDTVEPLVAYRTELRTRKAKERDRDARDELKREHEAVCDALSTLGRYKSMLSEARTFFAHGKLNEARLRCEAIVRDKPACRLAAEARELLKKIEAAGR